MKNDEEDEYYTDINDYKNDDHRTLEHSVSGLVVPPRERKKAKKKKKPALDVIEEEEEG